MAKKPKAGAAVSEATLAKLEKQYDQLAGLLHCSNAQDEAIKRTQAICARQASRGMGMGPVRSWFRFWSMRASRETPCLHALRFRNIETVRTYVQSACFSSSASCAIALR